MNKEKESFNRMVLLTAAKTFGIIFSFAIPMYLGRKLDVEVYGTYKQIMLFFWFAQVGLNFGLDDSAYYYLRKDPKNFPLYSLNALIFNLFATGLIWICMVVFKVEIGGVINNPDLVQYLPLLGYLILATVSSMQFAGILIGLNHFKERLAYEMGLELFKSLSILAGFMFFNSIYMVLVFLSFVMTASLIATLYIIHHYKKKEGLVYKDSIQHFRSQASFGIPLGLSRIFQNLLNMENFVISSFLGMFQFTYYSVGCFENPLINAAKASLFELINIELTDKHNQGDSNKSVEAWKRMTRKLFLIIVPFIVYMIFFSREIIVFIFSEKYLASVPFFIVFNFYIFFSSLNPEPIFRATSNTQMALKIKMIGTILGLGLIIAGAYWGGAMHALIGKVIAIILINFTGLYIGARLLNTKVRNLFQWKDFFKLLFVSILLGGGLKLCFNSLEWHPFWILALTFSIYVPIHFLLSCKFHLVKDDEISHISVIYNRIRIKFS